MKTGDLVDCLFARVVSGCAEVLKASAMRDEAAMKSRSTGIHNRVCQPYATVQVRSTALCWMTHHLISLALAGTDVILPSFLRQL